MEREKELLVLVAVGQHGMTLRRNSRVVLILMVMRRKCVDVFCTGKLWGGLANYEA
jgi:hypothetical protein